MNKPEQVVSRRMWTLSYRLKGLSFAIVAVIIFSQFYLDYYSKFLFITAGIAGYLVGWLWGTWTYQKK
ncbi:MAG: hypothetical protein UR94_C0004G0029 [Parcubacteria group bacterium GW2011_GWA2_36_10]|nr:MAG: hypothetical protein UR94_C0004G0029 [Parcubacteria group bacterium GW2011_GWA2_36_10]